MSPKELLYIKDALCHADAMKKYCCDIASQTQDPVLRNLLQDICSKQGEVFAKFYSLLN